LAINRIYQPKRVEDDAEILSEETSCDRCAAWLLGDHGGECDHVGVLTDATVERVRELRAEGLTPKLIARKLALPLRDVSRLVIGDAAERGRSNEVVGCWVNAGWSTGLTVPEDRGWADVPHDTSHPVRGIVTALVAREHRHDSVSVCVYLVDVFCLGVKNAVPPRVMPIRDLATFRALAFRGHESGEPVAVPLDLVQHLVIGAVDNARRLGFEPHADLAPATGHLGDWVGPSAIGFGLDGKPTYIQGPYDDPNKVLRTLDRAVGSDGYDFTVDASALNPGAFRGMDLRVVHPDVREIVLTTRR
jgi:hypothetical protein